jgi:glycosyltransferase involved in cell wall biosynthesis
MSSAPHRRKTLLVVAYTYYESDPRVIREAEAAVEAGFEVDVLALRRKGLQPTEVLRGVRLIRLNQDKYQGHGYLRYVVEYLKFFLKCFTKTTSLFFQRWYSVIHVHNPPDFMVFSSIIPRLFGAKVILDIHDPMPNTFASKFNGRDRGFYFWLLLWQERLSAAFSSRVITVHHPVKDGILTKHGLTPDSVDVIANFADDTVFPARESFTADGKVRLVFHGSILERYGLRTMMAGLAQVRHKDRISLKIIGQGDFSRELKGMIQSLKLESMIDFDNHTYPVHSIPERIADCNVGIVPMDISSITNYALPLKLLEYISLGLPVVTIRNDAISYYFNEEDCIFFDWDDPSSLSAALDRLAENPEILNHYRRRSMEIRGKFSWSGEKTKYMALLRQLTSNGRAY